MSLLGDIGQGTFWRNELKEDEELECEEDLVIEAREELEEDLERLEDEEELEEESLILLVNLDKNELSSFSALIEAV